MFNFQQDPFENFELGLAAATESGLLEPIAMQLATVGTRSTLPLPSVRTVLFKGIVRGGFSFYTNYESQKALEIAENPRASALFFWNQMEQQIRISGQVEKLTRAESENYFKTRPRISQLGAWASAQSQNLDSYETLEKKFQDTEQRYNGQEIPCPPQWGGYHLLPSSFEFWFGKTGRLHERYFYQRDSISSPWKKSMKFP